MSEVEEAPAEAAKKVDPETLVLRGKPVRVTRFRRGAIIAICGGGAFLVAGAAWMALGPVSFGRDAAADDAPQISLSAPPDVLAGAPTGYGDVPPLGPPLPGDLGRPILKHQQGTIESPAAGEADAAAARAEQAIEAERQRLAAEERAARESDVMLKGSIRSNTASAGGATATDASLQAEGEGRQSDGASPVGQSNVADDVNPHRIVAPPSPWTVQAGSVIAASLITGLNSDLPGLVTAQVTENVRDSVTGRHLLIPQGARVIGRYDNVVAYGQSRALVVWQRIILPDGSSIRIDNLPATDTEGYAGLSDRIDRHTWQLLKGVALSTLLGVGTELGSGSSESDLVRAIREAAQQGGARAGDQLVGRSLDIQPTLRVRPGWSLRIVVHKDLVLQPWRGGGD